MVVNFAEKYLCHTPQCSLTCRKFLLRGADYFTSPPKEIFVRILSPLKIHCPWPDFNPQTLVLSPYLIGLLVRVLQCFRLPKRTRID
jgi:hypothetical protein